MQCVTALVLVDDPVALHLLCFHLQESLMLVRIELFPFCRDLDYPVPLQASQDLGVDKFESLLEGLEVVPDRQIR